MTCFAASAMMPAGRSAFVRATIRPSCIGSAAAPSPAKARRAATNTWDSRNMRQSPMPVSKTPAKAGWAEASILHRSGQGEEAHPYALLLPAACHSYERARRIILLGGSP